MANPDQNFRMSECLVRYKEFTDPGNSGAPYDPRIGLERLLGVLSPDPKGIVLAGMGSEWYSGDSPLRGRVMNWLRELEVPPATFPLGRESAWSYCQRKNRKTGEIEDGSLVDLGVVVKKAELEPFKMLYSRSEVGAELAVPLVQNAVEFVVQARKHAEVESSKGQEPHKFDSMWRILGGVNSNTDQRKALAVFDIIEFLIKNPGNQRAIDISTQTGLTLTRLAPHRLSLGECGIINYYSPQKEEYGKPSTGWSIYTVTESQDVANMDPGDVLNSIRTTRKYSYPASLRIIIDYIKKFPDAIYEQGHLSGELGIDPTTISATLSALTDLGLLQRPKGIKGGETHSIASANDLTKMFYDLVLLPAKETADNLSAVPAKPFQRDNVATFLSNYTEERSQAGSSGGGDVRAGLVSILADAEGALKASLIVGLYNTRSQRILKSGAIRSQLENLIKLGLVKRSKPGYFELVSND